MIKKELGIPIRILKLEALLRRLLPTHPKYGKIESDLAKYRAGYYGEASLEYPLSSLTDENYTILHDIRLPRGDNKGYFQIDVLILSPRFFLILESKNIGGTLYFDKAFNQLIRSTNEAEEKFSDPILQVKEQAEHLKDWMAKHHFPPVPIETLVVCTHPKAVIKASPNYKEAIQKVTNNQALPTKIRMIEDQRKITFLPDKLMKKIIRLHIKQNTMLDPDILSIYKMVPGNILTGVHCPMCSKLPLARHRGSWFCPQCQVSSKITHLTTLMDYFLLIDSTITNKQFREMLQLSSISIASKLLTSLNLSYSGEKRHRKYELSHSILQQHIDHSH